jgi:hypothetical protein
MTPSNYRKPRFPSSFHPVISCIDSEAAAAATTATTTSSSSSCSFLDFIQEYNEQCRQDRLTTSLCNNNNYDCHDEEDQHSITLKDSSSVSSSSRSRCSPQDIALLEPHLAAFRQQQQQHCSFTIAKTKTTTESTCISADDTMTSNHLSSDVPPQLLRIIRFFPMKWYPIKRALLRPPPSLDHYEVGVNLRLSLAKVMYDKQLLSTVEYDLLEQQVVYHQNYHNKDNNKGRNETRLQTDARGITHELKITFSRLPMIPQDHDSIHGIGTQLRTILEEYCHQYTSSNPMNTTRTDPRGGENLPLPDQVAEWALLSFCGLVFANGIDAPKSQSRPWSMESQMVGLMTNEMSSSSFNISIFVQAVKRMVESLLVPPILYELSDWNLLCLARFLSYLDVNVTDGLLAHGISACFVGAGVGRLNLQLPKLIASYVSIMVNHRKRIQEQNREQDKNLDEELFMPSFWLAFQGRIQQRLVESMIVEQQHHGGEDNGEKIIKNDLERRNKLEKFTNLLFQIVEYMLLQ